MGDVEIGISGWKYDGWKGTFYPKDLPASKELEFASRELPTIEINSTFYGMQRPSSFEHWYDTTPPPFTFSVKANRYITHIKRLKDVEIPIANFFSGGILALKEKLGPILWQFPPSMQFNPERFEEFAESLPHNFEEAVRIAKKSSLSSDRQYLKIKKNFKLRHAVEIRNFSFLNPWFVDIMRKYRIAIVFADTAGRWPYLEDITSDFLYLRLHGDSKLYKSGYDDQTLDFWANRINKWKDGKTPKDQLNISDTGLKTAQKDIYVYFDNDSKVKAPYDAKRLIKKIKNS